MSTNENHENCTISDEAIARRAYEIWEARGCPEEDGSDNWEAAKLQLLAETQTGDGTANSCADGRRGPLLRFFDRLRNRAA